MFDCSGLTCEELSEMVDSARQEYRRLVTGKAVRVVVDQNGERVEFTAANASRLLSYIQTLIAEMRKMGCPCVAQTAPTARAFKFIF